jgi:hypothetical protein
MTLVYGKGKFMLDAQENYTIGFVRKPDIF